MSQGLKCGVWTETETQWEVCEGGGWGCFQAFKTQNRWFSVVLVGGGGRREGRAKYRVGRLLGGRGPAPAA